MLKLRKIAVATFATLAGLAGLLFTVAPSAALGQGDSGHGNATVLADSPWGSPQP